MYIATLYGNSDAIQVICNRVHNISKIAPSELNIRIHRQSSDRRGGQTESELSFESIALSQLSLNVTNIGTSLIDLWYK